MEEGSIYQRKSDGLWVGSIHLDWVGGKRRRKYVYGKTQAEVREQLSKVISERDRGFTIRTERQTVEQYLTWWLAEVIEPSRRPSTLESYSLLVNRHILPMLGKRSLSKLSTQDVQSLLNQKLRDGLSRRTVQYIRGVLRSALNYAVKADLVGRNVAALATPPAAARFEITPLSVDQARSFLDQVSGDRLEALYRVVLAIGLRKGEALGLRWQDVDLENGRISVRHAMQRVDGTLSLVEPKSVKSRRTITIPPQLVRYLRQHRTKQLEERMIAGSRWNDHDLVFTTSIGTPVDQSRLSREMHAHLEAAGLPRIRFHDFRHTAASILVAEGIHPRTVMEILGHSQISITMNTYSHILEPTMRDATDRIGALLMDGKEAG